MIAAVRWERLRVAVGLLPPLLLAGAGAYTAAQQVRYSYPAGFEWPTHFARVHPIAWLAVVMLVGVVLLDSPTRHPPAE
jgi:hypothetical protein